MRKPSLGQVIIHRKGTNPYKYSRDCGCVGKARAKVLQDFRNTGELPKDVCLWDDLNKEPITSPNQVDWAGLD